MEDGHDGLAAQADGDQGRHHCDAGVVGAGAFGGDVQPVNPGRHSFVAAGFLRPPRPPGGAPARCGVLRAPENLYDTSDLEN